MTAKDSKIIYTLTDEAPRLATYAFLPIIKTVPHKAFYTDLQIVEQAGRVFIARKVHGSGGTPDGIIMFDLGEL